MTPSIIAAALVKSGLITEYQAQQLNVGHTKFTLGGYLITDGIGQGGMGHVFKGVHRVMGRECAVKVLPLDKSTAESRDELHARNPAPSRLGQSLSGPSFRCWARWQRALPGHRICSGARPAAIDSQQWSLCQ